MGFYKPPVLNDGCIFREDFRSPALAASNGAIVEGSGIKIDNGAKISTSNTGWIRYPNVSMRGPASTVMFDIETKDVTTISDIMASYLSTRGGISFYVINGNITALTWAETAIYSIDASPALVGRHTYVYTRSSNVSTDTYWYRDGVAIVNFPFKRPVVPTRDDMIVFGQEASSYRNLAGYTMHGLRIYNRALSAEEIRADYYRTRGL